MIDTHCHLDMPEFDGDRAQALARAAAAGVQMILVPGVRPRTFSAISDLARMCGDRQTPAVVTAFGVHPQVVTELDTVERALALDPDRLAAMARDCGAVAIGECGLDGATADLPLQESIFRAQVRAARAAGLPLVIHVFRAHGLAPRILAEEKAGEVGGVMHSYSGGVGLLGVYRDLGLYFSFAGPVTYSNARRPLEAARAVPDALLLAETDAPDQAPEPHRGQRSEPAFVAEVIAGLAAARRQDPRETAALTTRNARRLFRLESADPAHR